jgi:5-methyltetrahydropteroyltriglutamate--homocysteine methyltransferase
MKSYAYGFPRLGPMREFKKLVEGFWKKKIGENELWKGLEQIQKDNNNLYAENVDLYPDGEMTLYDHMLDTAILCGVFSPKDLNDYYALCRGSSALEMTKWFNTNYHYLVTDFAEMPDVKFKLNFDHFALRFKKGDFPAVIGPFTFLKLSKGIPNDKFKDMFLDLVGVYKELFGRVKNIQIEEPAFALDLTEEEIALIAQGYGGLSGSDCRIFLMTYYGGIDWIERLLELPVAAIGLDFVRGEENFEYIHLNGFPENKSLIACFIDGRNVWRNDIASVAGKLRKLSEKTRDLYVSNAAPLYHLPISVDVERGMNEELKKRLSFAREKLEEIRFVTDSFESGKTPDLVGYGSYGKNADVQKRIESLSDEDFVKSAGLRERRKIHDDLLKLPLFPTTTIGSYPQTAEVRKKRAAFRKGEITKEEYDTYIRGEIDKLVSFQEDLGLDVLVHGEFERTDMVEFFAQNLEGIATTTGGWIISYGTRAYRPPIIFGDVSRPKPMTVKEIKYAQSRTKKPVKGMLTGAVTIIAWSFCREDIPVSEVAYQIGLCLKDEIKDYEKEGIRIVQVDEAAFREKAPLKKKDWPAYFDWAVKSFNLTTNTDPKTQIHSHMCYSEFGEIIEHINNMDFDVISIEASRSKGDIIEYFEKVDFKRQIGLGVWDIHSPAVPSTEKMTDIVKRSLRQIPKENFWLNPDCGLKTRDWPETEASLKNLVEVASELRSGKLLKV